MPSRKFCLLIGYCYLSPLHSIKVTKYTDAKKVYRNSFCTARLVFTSILLCDKRKYNYLKDKNKGKKQKCEKNSKEKEESRQY